MKSDISAKIAEKIALDKERFFPDADILMDRFIGLPLNERPIFTAFCANFQDLAAAMAVAPGWAEVRYVFPEDIGLEKHSKKKTDHRLALVEKQIDDIEYIFGYGSVDDRTKDYEIGRGMIRQELLKVARKKHSKLFN